MDKLTESELKDVSALLGNALSPDQSLRSQSEQLINNMKISQPDKLILALLFILTHQQDNFELSAILLKNLISVMTANPENFVWTRLTRETQTLAKQTLLSSLISPATKPEVCRKICNAAAELEGTLVDLDEDWPELLSVLNSLLASGDNVPLLVHNPEFYKKICGFQLLSDIFPYVAHAYLGNLKGMLEAFKNTLIGDDFPLKMACVKAFCTVVLCLENEAREFFEDLVPLIAEEMKKALIQDKEEELKSFIVDLTTLADAAPRFLKKGFSHLFQIGIVVAKTALRNDEIPGLAIEMLVSAIERAPSLLLQEHMPHETGAYFTELFAAILHLMRYYTRNFDQNWIYPKDTLCLYSDDDDHLVLGQKAIDRILGCTKRELGLSLFGPKLLAYLERTEDWRCKYIAFLAASRVGPHIKSPVELSVFIPIVASHAANHSDSRIRFSAVRCMAALAEECDELFHFHYHQDIAKALVAALKDRVPRIQQEACIATKNFVEKIRQEQADRYIVALMECLEKLVDNGTPQIQEVAMAAIGSLAEATPDTFRKYYYSLVMPSLIKVLECFNDAKYKKFRGQTVECITIIAKAVGKEPFKNYFQQVARAMIEIQRNQLKSKDPQKTFLLTSWQRICSLFSSELAPYAHEIIPSMLELVLSIGGVFSGKVDVKSLAEPDGEAEEKEEAISLIGTLIEHLGAELEGYTEKFEGLLVGILQLPPNNSLKQAASNSLKGLLASAIKAKRCTAEKIQAAAKKYIAELIKAVKLDANLDNIEAELNAVKGILNALERPCFTEAEVVEFFEEIMKLIDDSNNRAMASAILSERSALEEGEAKVIREDYERESEMMILLAQTIGSLVKSHPNETAGLTHMVYNDMLKTFVDSSAAPSQTVFALTIIVAAVKYLTYSRISDLYTEFTQHILNHAFSENPRLKNIAIEGLAAAVAGAGSNAETITNQCFNFVQKSLNMPMPEQVSRKEWKMAHEKAVVSLSQIILSQNSGDALKATQMITLWIQHLPLKLDKEQGKNQIDILAGMMVANPEVVVGPNGENVKEIIRIMLDVLDTDQIGRPISEKMLKGFGAMIKLGKWKELISKLHSELPKIKQNKLAEYIHISTKAAAVP